MNPTHAFTIAWVVTTLFTVASFLDGHFVLTTLGLMLMGFLILIAPLGVERVEW